MEDLLQEIILKAYQINKDTKHSIFLNFYGHTNELQIQYHKDGWKLYSEPDYKKEVKLDGEFVLIELEQIINELEKLGKGDENYVQ